MIDQTDVQVTEVPKDIGKTNSLYLGASVKQGHKSHDRYFVPSKKADVKNSGGNLGFYYSKVLNTTKEVSGRFSFHCRNFLALVVGNTVYGALEVVNFTVERSEKGKELLKRLIQLADFFSIQRRIFISFTRRTGLPRTSHLLLITLLAAPLSVFLILLFASMIGISSIGLTVLMLICLIAFVTVSLIIVPILLVTSIIIGIIMLFASLMGWNQDSLTDDGFADPKADRTKYTVSNFYQHLKSGTLLTSFYNSTVNNGTTEPSIAHMFIEIDNNAGYNVMASESKTRGAELRDVIREKDSIDLGANVVEDIDSPATNSRSR